MSTHAKIKTIQREAELLTEAEELAQLEQAMADLRAATKAHEKALAQLKFLLNCQEWTLDAHRNPPEDEVTETVWREF